MNLNTILNYLKRAALAFAVAFLIAFTLVGLKNAFADNLQFNKNLYYGMRRDADVVRLQDILKLWGYLSPSITSTGNYLGMTVDAVKKFQTANNIKPASGYFGPLTRAVANIKIVTPNTTTIQTPVPAPTVPIIKNTSATSTYWGKIRISDANHYSNNINDEYIRIENNSTTTEKISITGFRLVNSSGDEFIIPKGHNLPGARDTASDNIEIARYDYAKIFTGRQEKQINFRENICTGYLDQSSDFHGKLEHNCPRPNVSGSLNLSDHCIRVFESTQSCRTVDTARIEVPACIAFSEAHFNYQGCVNDNKGRSDFYRNDWLVWMQRYDKFLRPIHDKISLFDTNGKIVSVFTY